MPRQAAASRAFAANGSTRQLLQPPGDLNELEKAEFVDVVLGSPASHFQPSDIAMISAYARAVVAERIAAGELAAAYVVSGGPCVHAEIAVCQCVATVDPHHKNPYCTFGCRQS